MKTLYTIELTLEPQRAVHAEAMFEVLVDPAIYEHENEPPTSVDWLRARLARLESRCSPDGGERWLNWVVRNTAGNELIGFVQATLRADRSAAIAYVFASPHWGRGWAGQAVQAMLDELAVRFKVIQSIAVLKRENQRSLRLLQRLGFTPASASLLAAHPIEPDELLMGLQLPSVAND